LDTAHHQNSPLLCHNQCGHSMQLLIALLAPSCQCSNKWRNTFHQGLCCFPFSEKFKLSNLSLASIRNLWEFDVLNQTDLTATPDEFISWKSADESLLLDIRITWSRFIVLVKCWDPHSRSLGRHTLHISMTETSSA
jgi:hypothetical protein